MSLVQPFLKMQRLTVLVIALSVAMGIAAILTLPRQEDPIPAERYASVITPFPGASARRVESLITEPLEDSIREVAEVKKLKSFSRVGISVVTVELQDSVDNTEEIWSIVRNQVNDATARLPSGAGQPSLDVRLLPAVTLLVGLTAADEADPVSLGLLGRLSRQLKTELNNVAGTEEVKLYGLPDEEILVTLDPVAAASAGITAGDVSSALAAADAKTPAGLLRDEGGTLIVEVAGELDSIARISQVPIRLSQGGSALRVGDVATIARQTQTPPDTMAFLAGKRGIAVGATMQPDLRVDQWAAGARAVVDQFKANLPPDIAVTVIIDQSVYTQGRLIELAQNFLLGVVLVIGILFLLMGWRSALLIGVSLPLSVCIVLGALSLLGIPLHQMSVTGAIIALGLLIDNAIVVVDDYNLLRNRGARRLDAARKAVAHLQIPLLASTVTTALTFAPIMLMPGGAGDFVATMALTVILAIFSSLFLSLTVVPALAAFVDLRKASADAVRGNTGIKLPKLAQRYREFLNYTVDHPRRVAAFCLILPLLGFFLASQLDEQFFPPVDRDQFQVQLSLPPDSPIEETVAAVEKIDTILNSYGTDIVKRDWFVGENPPKAFYNIILNNNGLPSFAAAIVTTSSPEVTAALLPKLQPRLMRDVRNGEVLVLPFDQGPPVPAPVEVRILGDDLEAIRALGEEVRTIMSQSQNVTYTRARIAGGRPKAFLKVDEAALAGLGLRLTDVTRALRDDLEGTLGGSVLEDREEMAVRVRLGASERGSIESLLAREITGRGPDGPVAIPLSAVASVDVLPEEASISRYNRQRSNTVQGFIVPFTLPSIALKDFQARLEAANLDVPPGVQLQFGGESETQAQAIGNLLSSVGVLMIIMVGVIILTFNSFRFAAVIMSVAFLSVGIAFVPLFIFGQPLGFMAIVGAMGLIGLAINGAIVVLSALRSSEGARAADPLAIRETVVDCTRHIVGTTLTTIAGFLPLIIWGQNFWKPLALAVAGGVLGSSILALFYVPAMFTWIARAKNKAAGKAASTDTLGTDQAFLPAAE
ncbi:MAG: efflux RND transporter permease subunit [Pseudomonadota bacterium]